MRICVYYYFIIAYTKIIKSQLKFMHVWSDKSTIKHTFEIALETIS